MSKPTVIGVSRMFDNKRAALICFDREPTDDELRDMHETLRAERFGQAEPVAASVLCWVHEDELPESLPEAVYDALFPYSRVDGVRLFPLFSAPQPDRIAELERDLALAEESVRVYREERNQARDVVRSYREERDALTEEVERYKKDAERYRLLRIELDPITEQGADLWFAPQLYGEELDKEVDAAIARYNNKES